MTLLIKPTFCAAVSCFILASIGFTHFYQANVLAKLNEWKLLPQSEQLTELYFTDHTNLPKTFTPNTQQSIRFTINNAELEEKNYTYIIAASDSHKTWSLDSGKLYLGADRSKNLDIEITLPQTDSNKLSLKVYIQYPKSGRNSGQQIETQTIHYFMDKTGADIAQREEG